MPILTKLYGWLAAAGALVLAIGAAILYGRSKGKADIRAKVDTAQAQQKVNTAQAVLERNEVRTDVQAKVARLPSNPAVEVHVPAARPVPGSAAGQLQRDWSRD